jgi:hypothetical protein
MADAQNFDNHRRFIPLFHIGVLLSLTVNFAWAVSRLGSHLSVDNAVSVLLATALFLLAFYARSFPLKVQDRVIRLEMHLRMVEALPVEMHARIKDFTPGQLVALRFATDAELPALAAAVLKDDIRDQNTIKKMIKNWHPDTLRA